MEHQVNQDNLDFRVHQEKGASQGRTVYRVLMEFQASRVLRENRGSQVLKESRAKGEIEVRRANPEKRESLEFQVKV